MCTIIHAAEAADRFGAEVFALVLHDLAIECIGGDTQGTLAVANVVAIAHIDAHRIQLAGVGILESFRSSKLGDNIGLDQS